MTVRRRLFQFLTKSGCCIIHLKVGDDIKFVKQQHCIKFTTGCFFKVIDQNDLKRCMCTDSGHNTKEHGSSYMVIMATD